MTEARKKPAPKLAQYKNTTLENIFTEAGRCAPEGVVTLSTSQAKSYKGLELCKTK